MTGCVSPSVRNNHSSILQGDLKLERGNLTVSCAGPTGQLTISIFKYIFAVLLLSTDSYVVSSDLYGTCRHCLYGTCGTKYSSIIILILILQSTIMIS